MEQKICTELRRYKVDVDIPYVLYEALLNNPSLDEDVVKDRIDKAVYDALYKAYNNQKVLPAAVRKYLEAKYGMPVMPDKSRVKDTESEVTEDTDETLQDKKAPVEVETDDYYENMV